MEGTMFWDRQAELRTLEREYARERGSLVVIYGRRRVGKTTLIKEFIRDKPAMYFLADERLETVQRRRFQAVLSDFAGDPLLARVSAGDWDTLFQLLIQRLDPDQKTVLVIDEFQYLAKTTPGYPSFIQGLWDEQFKDMNVMLILCGSLVGMMRRLVLDAGSPLYGRRTGQLRLQPLQFADYIDVFDGSFNDLVPLYAVTGGIPRYIELLRQDGEDLLEQIVMHILQPGSALYDEPRFLLTGEVSETTTYFSILQTIASGDRKIGHIGRTLEIQANRLSAYLQTLEDLNFVERRVPVTAGPRSRRGLYYISDHLARFWFRYVFPNQNYLEIGRTSNVEAQLRATFDSEFTAQAFEECCASYLWRLADQGVLPFIPQRVGRWWGRNEEMDLVALNQETRDIMFGECKWTGQPVGIDVLKALYGKAQQVRWRRGERQEWFILFSREGFQEALIDRARHPNADGRHDVTLVHDGRVIAGGE
ncbi:MAG: ATP-binding protein [Anaerolineae bacterium]|jgi:AAA+ ATPase superfamily predicted ATPase